MMSSGRVQRDEIWREYLKAATCGCLVEIIERFGQFRICLEIDAVILVQAISKLDLGVLVSEVHVECNVAKRLAIVSYAGQARLALPGPAGWLAGLTFERHCQPVEGALEGDGEVEVFPKLVENQVGTCSVGLQTIGRIQIGYLRRERRRRVEKGSVQPETKLAIVKL